jgi:DNA-directed RNA polymerase beta subunit
LPCRRTASTGWSGNERWQARVAKAVEEGDLSVATTSGLSDIFEEISPIEDFQGTMSLSFSDPEFADPKYTMAECKDRDATYSAPLYVKAEFMNNNTGEIKQQTVFMGDFPLMTEKGTFVVNGTERVVVSQLVRSRAPTLSAPLTRPATRTSLPQRSFRPAVPGSSSRSTSATRSACASTASVSSRSRCC